jgi:hypothetical protein
LVVAEYHAPFKLKSNQTGLPPTIPRNIKEIPFLSGRPKYPKYPGPGPPPAQSQSLM